MRKWKIGLAGGLLVIVTSLVMIPFTTETANMAEQTTVKTQIQDKQSTDSVAGDSKKTPTSLELAVTRFRKMEKSERETLFGPDDTKLVTAVKEDDGYGFVFGAGFSIEDENGQKQTTSIEPTTVGELKQALALEASK
ncbi:hypothetical protein BAU15_07415 [Enterococcus sp. JM4C]|uniref:hypothetical protein n=1 Tax=Candidatus Enterococcus huntleyi TaxID=1857217 RepID=UPI00137AC4B5|nr:hypothetical protein [Enterococcus sp. JM4C]KAF1297534.1 hypothetical protein BAU15_07415 [Enterococcus sp. JM4C]